LNASGNHKYANKIRVESFQSFVINENFRRLIAEKSVVEKFCMKKLLLIAAASEKKREREKKKGFEIKRVESARMKLNFSAFHKCNSRLILALWFLSHCIGSVDEVSPETVFI
jgi:hypothetical protein